MNKIDPTSRVNADRSLHTYSNADNTRSTVASELANHRNNILLQKHAVGLISSLAGSSTLIVGRPLRTGLKRKLQGPFHQSFGY